MKKGKELLALAQAIKEADDFAPTDQMDAVRQAFIHVLEVEDLSAGDIVMLRSFTARTNSADAVGVPDDNDLPSHWRE